MKKKTILMLAAMALLLTVTVGSTLAFLVTSSGPVANVFQPASVSSEVVETFDGTTKSNVRIRNTGNVDAKIRAAIVVTWQDESGHTLPAVPQLGTDYSLSIGEGWTKDSNGYYVWNDTVAPEDKTGVLICECKQLTQEEGRRLCVEVIGSAIQAEGGADWGTFPTTAR